MSSHRGKVRHAGELRERRQHCRLPEGRERDDGPGFGVAALGTSASTLLFRTKPQRLVQAPGQLRQGSPFDQKGDYTGKLPVDLVVVHGPLEILSPATAASPDAGPDHAAPHLQVTIPEVT